MDKSSMNDLCYLIEIYKGDAAFSKYILTNLLEKMSRGNKLEFESFLIAFLHSLQHKEHLKELVDILLNYEQFHSSTFWNLTYQLLDGIMENRVYEHEQGLRLIKAI